MSASNHTLQRTPCSEMRNTRWAFFGACTRGTGVALFNYAHSIEAICGAKTVLIICAYFPDPSYNSSVRRFRRRFPLVLEPKPSAHLQIKHHPVDASFSFRDALSASNATHLYASVSGIRMKDRQIRGQLRKLPAFLAVHAVFDARSPWGDAFAKISEAVRGNRVPVVPRMVTPLPPGTANLRASLRVPSDATVFCSYGGAHSFNLAFVRSTVCQAAALHSTNESLAAVWFLFANHAPFCGSGSHPRAIFLPNLGLPEEKRDFINSCDAMLHARGEGETFGQAIAEFSQANKPILVWSGTTKDTAHLRMLGNRSILYSQRSLFSKLASFDRTTAALQNWRAYEAYSPARVMRKFSKALLRPRRHAQERPGPSS